MSSLLRVDGASVACVFAAVLLAWGLFAVFGRKRRRADGVEGSIRPLTLRKEIERRRGPVICESVPDRFPNPRAAATALGLDASGLELFEIDESEAVAVARDLLRYDLAYEAEVMPEAEATAWVERFMAECEVVPGGSRFYTNQPPGLREPKPTPLEPGESRSYARTSATAATFDAGILVLTTTRTGCLWVMDED